MGLTFPLDEADFSLLYSARLTLLSFKSVKGRYHYILSHLRPPPIVSDLDSNGDNDMIFLTYNNELKLFTFPTVANPYKLQESKKTLGYVVNLIMISLIIII